MAGEKTTCFALTEPNHGSDPNLLETTAETDGDEWVINGRKSWISNGPYADFAMVFARTSGQPGRIDGISCFLVDADTPGFEVGDIHRPMGHAWVAPSELENRRRLPGRRGCSPRSSKRGSTKRWTGSVTVAVGRRRLSCCRLGVKFLIEKAVDYAEERETFGEPLIDRQGISFPRSLFGGCG